MRNHRILLDKEAQTALICVGFFLHSRAEAEVVGVPALRPVTWKCHYEHSVIIIKTMDRLGCHWSQLFAQVCVCQCGLLSVGVHICEYMHGSYFCACIYVFYPFFLNVLYTT